MGPNVRPVDWLMIFLLGMTWGGTFLVQSLALRGISPFWLASARIGFAALFLAGIWSLRGFRLFEVRPSLRDTLKLLLVGICSTALPFMLLSWGQQYVASGFAGVSMAAVGLLVLPLAHFLVPHERLNLRKFLGFLIGFFGVVVLIGFQAFESSGNPLETAGRIACLTASAGYAISSVTMRNLPKVDPIGLAAMTMLIGTCVVVPTAFVVEGPVPKTDATTLGLLLLLALVPTAGANLLRVLVIRSAGPGFMSLTAYQVPVWAVIFGSVFLNEPLPASLVIALALILSGVAISQWGTLRRMFSPTSRLP
ncbi:MULTISPECIES: DMT family transporter [Halocynthiibacter]|uniref:DMT family transporter n=1 Tax=Halocynthiibacter halioticoli TaxID=2986804 RepID=A0AAE3LQT2_9RHOB|nr:MULTISPECIES: DMT family transporter [Halocynthiibacter]MCV6823873.1 DMT family transporter [Halocynthiibacter halioticoli]MCW4056874.1 DMT family transporter [Halocynthiibacter sp. SDUM655004]